MAKKKVKLDQDIYRKATECAKRAGYSSIDEFVSHIVEKEIASQDENASAKEIEKKLRGLGYIS